MVDRIVESQTTTVPDIPEVLQNVLSYQLSDAKERMDSGEDIIPFTVLAIKDNLFIEEHEGSTPASCFAQARHTVEHAVGADAYGFCYDGYIEVDDGTVDALIAEGGVPGSPEGYAIGLVYTEGEEGEIKFEPEATYIGNAPNFMAALVDGEPF